MLPYSAGPEGGLLRDPEMRKEQRRLMIVIPITLGIIFLCLYLAFDSVADALTIVAMLPLVIAGGALSLLITRTPFSISAPWASPRP